MIGSLDYLGSQFKIQFNEKVISISQINENLVLFKAGRPKVFSRSKMAEASVASPIHQSFRSFFFFWGGGRWRVVVFILKITESSTKKVKRFTYLQFCQKQCACMWITGAWMQSQMQQILDAPAITGGRLISTVLSSFR